MGNLLYRIVHTKIDLNTETKQKVSSHLDDLVVNLYSAI